MLPDVGSTRPWTDPEIVSINRLPMRPPTTAFPTLAEARSHPNVDAGSASPWRRSLDGRWSFRRYDSPDAVPGTALTGSTDGRAWRRQVVPSNWTLTDPDDPPHYTNVQMPFPGPPPRLPERNPTGVYRRGFVVPRSWGHRRVVLHVGGAESVHVVYLNGRFVGYGTDSRLASEFDITDHVEPGRNDIAIVVVKFSAHSYVEDQDQWWMAGLHREVFVEARAQTHIRSVACDASFDAATGSGRLVVRTEVGGPIPPGPGWRTRIRVETLRNTSLHRPVTADVPDRFAVPYVFEGHHTEVAMTLDGIEAWSAERPTRYRVVAELIGPGGESTEFHAQLIGFRSIEVAERELRVNGAAPLIFGVNRHDHHPKRGKAVTIDDMRADLLAMRRHNITAVRCSHYPNDPRLLDLCDEIGMYVVDEANIESHAYNTSLCNDPRYRSAWLARGARMVERDRNHPSVILWSLGNESGYGSNHDALAGWIRHADPSRPLHYEGAIFHDGWFDGGRPATDVVCPMYPPHAQIEAYRGDRPLIMCEYSHAMGNSNGGLADYWDVITSTPGLQGGFIWEWKDHGILTRLPNGRRGFAHGGQFGTEPHDGNFVADGLMSSDLVPHPAIQEVEWVYRPVIVTGARRRSPDALIVENRRSFTDLTDLEATWELLAGGTVRATGTFDVGHVGPAESVRVELPCDVPSEPDVLVTIRWTQRQANEWAPAGHQVAIDQIVLRPPVSSSEPPELPRDATGFAVEPRLEIFRAPIDNDGFKLMPELSRRIRVGGTALVAWQDAGVDRREAEQLVEHDHRVERPDERSVVHHHVVDVPDDLDDLARVGVSFELANVDLLRWYGRGPLENYPDRNRGAVLGVWERPIDAPPYLIPQEFGLRTDCRWVEFVSDDGTVVRLDVIRPTSLHVSATHFTTDDLYVAEHETDLRPRRRVVVHVDVAHRGLGTASCGPDILPQHRVPTGRHRFGYRLTTFPVPSNR